MTKKWSVNVVENDKGSLELPLPDELMVEVGWNEGDTLNWKDNGNGTWTLSKVEKMPIFVVKVVSTFYQAYAVRAKEKEHAMDEVSCEDAGDDVWQKHLGEQITEVVEVTEEEYVKLYRENNEYLSEWSDEQILSRLHQIDYKE
jgi:hypothetical protein